MTGSVEELVDMLIARGVLPVEHRIEAIQEIDKWLNRFLRSCEGKYL